MFMFNDHLKALAYLLREGKLELYLDICARASIIYVLHDTLQDSYLLHLLTLVGAMKLGLDEVCFQVRTDVRVIYMKTHWPSEVVN